MAAQDGGDDGMGGRMFPQQGWFGSSSSSSSPSNKRPHEEDEQEDEEGGGAMSGVLPDDHTDRAHQVRTYLLRDSSGA